MNTNNNVFILTGIPKMPERRAALTLNEIEKIDGL